MKSSHAIGHALGAIEAYRAMDLTLDTEEDGTPTPLGRFLDSIYASAKQLYVAGELFELASASGGAYEFRSILQAITRSEDIFEHFGIALGTEALYRAEAGVNRLVDLVGILPKAAPPELSKKFLRSAANCFLFELDDECIVMCRGALEVLVEVLAPEDRGRLLGEAITALERRRRISTSQAVDMREINRQARDILHAEAQRSKPDALDCLKRLTRLLAQLHPDWA